jgi:hypothetical protein
MAHAPTSRAAYDLIKGAVTTLANGEAAERVAASVDAALELARQTAIASSGDTDATAVITSVEVTVKDRSDDNDESPPAVAFNSRTPTDAGPKRPKPVVCGGGMCFTACYPRYCVFICIEWVGQCG